MIPSQQVGWDQKAKLLWQISKQLEQLISVTYNNSLPNPLLNILNQNVSAQTANLWITGSVKADTFNGLTITNNGTNVLNIAAGQSLIVPTGGTLGTAAYTNSTVYEIISNKATTFGTINDTLYPTVKAVNDAIISAVVGLLDFRGNYNASTNLFPSTGGSGVSGTILKGDFWIVSVAGILGGVTVTTNDLVIALIDTPAQTASNWTLQEHTFNYTPENITNKVTSLSGSSTDVQYPSAKLVYDQLLGKLSSVGTGIVNELTYWSGINAIGSLTTLTYPSLTELAYVKGVTSAIQSQFAGKLATGLALLLSGGTMTGNIVLGVNSRINLTLPTTNGQCSGHVTNSFQAGESVSLGSVVFFKSDGKWWLTDSDAVATCKGLIGICLEAKTANNAVIVALPNSFIRVDTWGWTAGDILYVGDAITGTLQNTYPTGADSVGKVAGFAIDPDTIYFAPSSDQQVNIA